MDKPICLWRKINDIITWEIRCQRSANWFREAVKYKIQARYVDKNGRYIILGVLIDNNPVIQVN